MGGAAAPDVAAAGRSGSSAAPSNLARSAASRSPSFAASRPSRSRSAATPVGREQELRRGEEDGALDLAGRPLVGRVERAQRIDLVAEELDADRQVHRWREDVHDAAAPGELAATGDLGHGRVAEIEQVVEQRVLVEACPHPELARLCREVVRGDRVLEQRLDARDEDARPTAAPRRECRDPGGRLVGDELAALVGEGRPRLQRDDGRRIAQPRAQFLGHPVADLRVPGDPDERLVQGDRRGEEGLRAVRDRDETGVPADATEIGRGTEALQEGGERPGRGEERGKCREVREAVAGTGPSVAGRGAVFGGRAGREAGAAAASRSSARRASATSASTAATSKSMASSSFAGACRAANSAATCSAMRRSRPRRPRIGRPGG